MRDPWVLVRYIHQDVGLHGLRCIQNQVQFEPRRVIQDRDRFGTYGAGGLRDAEQFIKPDRARQVMHANADVGKAQVRNWLRQVGQWCANGGIAAVPVQRKAGCLTFGK